ncbi:MAG: acyl-CoA dehydrogenase [Desulfobacteraceae bacterium]|nr:MAG: acyl-CoA dehydrogenase [Desulfobacteraceae bacterium]
MQVKELNDIINECRRFAKNEIRDQALEADLNPSPETVNTIWSKSAKLDIPSLLLPEIYGGAGYPALCGALVLDAFSSECAGIASVFAHHFAACMPLIDSLSDSCETYSTRIARMEGHGASPAAVIFSEEEGDGELVLMEKENTLMLTGITQPVGNTCRGGFWCIFANDPIQKNGVTCIFPDPDKIKNAFGKETRLPGLKINPFRQLHFQDFPINAAEIIGERGKSADLLKTTRAAFFGFVSAMAMGCTRSAYQKAFAYAEQRYQFGNTIIHHQEIQRMLGAMLMKLQMGTAGYTRLFSEERLHLPCSVPDPKLVKSCCTDMALEIILDAVQIHGGYGYMHEYGLEKIMRDVKVLQLLGGSNPYHHVRAIAEQL